MTEAVGTRRTRITPEREAELYAAVLDLLREVGYEALTMDAVAARTHSSKATLYRQWGGKPELVVRALRSQKRGSGEKIDTGSLRGDLVALISREDDCTMERDSDLMRAMAMAAHANPDLMQAFRELLVEPETRDLQEILQRAVDRGEIRPDRPALQYVVHMLVGAFATRTVVDRAAPTQEFLLSYVDAVMLPALGVEPS